jgi:hypothetical protein
MRSIENTHQEFLVTIEPVMPGARWLLEMHEIGGEL